MQPPSKKELQFPRLLSQLRSQAGLKQKEVARRIGVQPDTLARYERGVRRVSPQTLNNLIGALKLNNDQEALLRAAWEYDQDYLSRPAADAPADSTSVSAEPSTAVVTDADRQVVTAADANMPADEPIWKRATGPLPVAVSIPDEVAPEPEPEPEPEPARPTLDLPGAAELEAFITTHADDPQYDEEVRRLVMQSQLIALVVPVTRGAELDYPFRFTVQLRSKRGLSGWQISTIWIRPVFTSEERLQSALRINPQWGMPSTWGASVVPPPSRCYMEGSVLLQSLTPGEEWLGINLWSSHEFHLPPSGAPAEVARWRGQ